MTKTSIRTRYNGTLFRSKLEADWARAFDTLGIVWEYEKEGRYFGDVFYLPDFWLPRSRQFVEVKGVFEPDDCRKIHAVLTSVQPRARTSDDQPDIPIIAAMSEGRFFGWARRLKPTTDWYTFLTKDAVPTALLSCGTCHEWWFAHGSWGLDCQCCGENRSWCVESSFVSPLPGFPDLAELRRYATKPCASAS